MSQNNGREEHVATKRKNEMYTSSLNLFGQIFALSRAQFTSVYIHSFHQLCMQSPTSRNLHQVQFEHIFSSKQRLSGTVRKISSRLICLNPTFLQHLVFLINIYLQDFKIIQMQEWQQTTAAIRFAFNCLKG